jgi:hypothetical protein
MLCYVYVLGKRRRLGPRRFPLPLPKEDTPWATIHGSILKLHDRLNRQGEQVPDEALTLVVTNGIPWATIRGSILQLHDRLIRQNERVPDSTGWNSFKTETYMLMIQVETLLNEIQPLLKKCRDEDDEPPTMTDIQEKLDIVNDKLDSQAGSSHIPPMGKVARLIHEDDLDTETRSSTDLRYLETYDSDVDLP